VQLTERDDAAGRGQQRRDRRLRGRLPLGARLCGGGSRQRRRGARQQRRRG
jgi:hypothetical protein